MGEGGREGGEEEEEEDDSPFFTAALEAEEEEEEGEEDAVASYRAKASHFVCGVKTNRCNSTLCIARHCSRSCHVDAKKREGRSW